MKGKRPFYAYIAATLPHAPLQVPEEYEQRYAGKVTAERGEVLRHDRQHRRQRGPAAGEA